jgi:hypothetical protein
MRRGAATCNAALRLNATERAPRRIGDRIRLGSLQPLLHGATVHMADNSMTGTFQIPQDLLSEAKRSKPKNDRLHVEGWRNSWLSRLTEMLVGKDK